MDRYRALSYNPAVISQHLDWPERSVGQTGCWRQDGFRCQRAIVERGMRPDGIVMAPPCLDQHLRLIVEVDDAIEIAEMIDI